MLSVLLLSIKTSFIQLSPRILRPGHPLVFFAWLVESFAEMYAIICHFQPARDWKLPSLVQAGRWVAYLHGNWHRPFAFAFLNCRWRAVYHTPRLLLCFWWQDFRGHMQLALTSVLTNGGFAVLVVYRTLVQATVKWTTVTANRSVLLSSISNGVLTSTPSWGLPWKRPPK